MRLYDIRHHLQNGKTIFDLPLNVTYYARVSTLTEDQKHSLDNQISFFIDYICKNSRWTLVEGYVDEGITGTSALKRENFLKMVDDSKRGKFDLVITKEISRFARSTIDSIQYTQQMLLSGVGVYFLNDNINTFESDSELRLTIMASLVQEEVRKISSRVKFGYNESIKKGRVLGNDYIWGYVKDDGKLKLVEDEAKMVRLIFDFYVSGMGLHGICEKLLGLGYRNRSGNKFTYNTVKGIIQNPKYKGFYAGKKTEKIDYRHNKRHCFDEKDWVMYKAEDNVVPQIVDEDVWERANKILKTRKEKYAGDESVRYQDKTVYSGKIICAQHGTGYWRSMFKYKSGTREVWQCSVYKRGGKKDCNNPQLYLEDLETVLNKTVNKIFTGKDDIINTLISIYTETIKGEGFTKEIIIAEKEIVTIKKRKDKLLDLFMSEVISKQEFAGRNDEMNAELEAVEKRKKIFEARQNAKNYKTREIQNLKNIISKILKFENCGEVGYQKIIASILERVEVSPYDEDGNAPLKIYFKTGLMVETEIDFGMLETKRQSYIVSLCFGAA